MRKFIALALSFIMALALCTTAFAATYSDAYIWGEKGWEKYDLNGVTVSYTAPTESTTGGKVTSGTLGYYTINGEGPYVEVAKNDASFQMKVNDKTVCLAIGLTDYNCTGKSVKAGNKCGELDASKYDKSAILITVDKELYISAEDGDMAILVDGKVITAKTIEKFVVTHKWTTAEGKIIVDADKLAEVNGTITCKDCGTKATVTNDKTKIPTNAIVESLGEGVWMFWAENSTETNAKPVSPKTFDSGVAMYIGMGLMSTIGTATLIKKKEF